VIPRCARHVPFPTLQVQAVRCANLHYFFSQLRDPFFDGILHENRLAEHSDACRVFLNPSSYAIGCLSPSSPACSLAVGEIGGTIGAARIDVYDTFPYRPKNPVCHPRGNAGPNYRRYTTHEVDEVSYRRNALKRYVRPVTKALGIPLGGWHDFRHTLTTGLLRSGVSPKVVSDILGHSDVEITLNVYDHPETENFRKPLAAVADQLLRDVTKSDEAMQ
jgi:hypothetical protein